ncbi:DUF3575 domain-containing protein [Flagellimonas sp. 2504JD4-2]
MKKLHLTLMVCFLIGLGMKAQENVVKINPLSLLFGSLELGYERVVSEKQSFQIDLGYTSFTSGSLQYSGFGIGGQYRFYVQSGKNAPEGWFLAPVASFSSSKADDFKTTVFVAGGVAGYQWNWDPITLDLYGGPAFYSVDSNDTGFDFGFDGLGLRLGASLGLGF